MSRVRAPLPAPVSGEDHPGCVPGFFIMVPIRGPRAKGGGYFPTRGQMDRELISALWRLIEPVLEPDGIELVEVEFKPEGGRWVLRLYIDSPMGVTLDDCEFTSRQIGALLDIKDPIHRPYTLEVSSPGINRVLRKEKDFKLFAGSPVRLKTRRKVAGRRNFQGILKGMENSKIVIEVDGDRIEISSEDLEKARLDLPEQELFRGDLRRGSVITGD
jgi:ribosome maturation factor RimP